jgi:hypothetical protein
MRWLSHRIGRQPKTYVKQEAAITVFELLMMGGVLPETWCANKKLFLLWRCDPTRAMASSFGRSPLDE